MHTYLLRRDKRSRHALKYIQHYIRLRKTIPFLPWDEVRGKVDDLIAGLVGFVSALGPVQ